MARTANPHLREARRSQILRAAARCFARQGFHRTTMREVYREAGLSAGAVYNYFPSKEAVIEAVAAQERREDEELLRLLREEGDPARGFARCLREILARAADPELAAMGVELSAESVRNPRVRRLFDANRARTRKALIAFLREASARGAIDGALDLPVTADVLLMLAEAAYYHAALESAVPRAKLGTTLATLVTRFLAPPATASTRKPR